MRGQVIIATLFQILALTSAKVFEDVEKIIPGTILETGRYYFLRMSQFPNGFISLSDETIDPIDHCDIKVYENNYDRPTAKSFKQWAFLAAPNETDWYHIVNGGRPGEYVSWGKRKSSDGNTTYILNLKLPAATKVEKDHYLFRPVKPKVPTQFNRIQLRLKSFPDAFIKWEKIDDSIYLKVQRITNETQNDYEGYSDEFRKTCFTFDDDGKSHIHTFATARGLTISSNFVIILLFFLGNWLKNCN